MEGTRSVPNLLNINQRKHEVFPTLLQGWRLSKNFKIERKSLALLKGSSKIFKIERKA